MITAVKQSIFDTNKDMIVCPVNCNGVMGKGLALQFKKLYPEMFERYRDICQRGLLSPGKLWMWHCNDNRKNVLCFPTKQNWWQPSKIEYIVDGLRKFVDTYKSKEIYSIAFPLLGAGCGQLDKKEILEEMQYWLAKCDNCDIEICIA